MKNTVKIMKSGDERTDRYPINDIFCRACRTLLAKVCDYRYIQMVGYDRRIEVDCLKGTATVKCKCGVVRVIRSRGNDDEGEMEDLGVWLEETDEGNCGEHEGTDKGADNPN